MKEWNSFTRIEAAFNKEISDRVPKYEGTIEIPELNPIANGQRNPRGLLFFNPRMINRFHNDSLLRSSFKDLVSNPRSLRNLAGGSPKKKAKLHLEFNYDMFIAIPGIPMVFKEKIFKDFYTEEDNKVIR